MSHFSTLKLHCFLFTPKKSTIDLYNREFTGTAVTMSKLQISLFLSVIEYYKWKLNVGFLTQSQRPKTRVTLQKEMYEIMR